jgi:hypothetical protein
MMTTRQRNAWLWVAIAALALAYVARAQAGIEHARACTAPVIEFLSAPHTSRLAVNGNTSGISNHEFARPGKLALLHDSGSSVWTPILPVLFIGLLFPLTLLSLGFIVRLGRTPAAPSLPASFQRPPPVLIA